MRCGGFCGRPASCWSLEPVFRSDWPVSTFFLKNDRGKFIRTRDGYRALFADFDIVEETTFRLAMHELCGFVARKRPVC